MPANAVIFIITEESSRRFSLPALGRVTEVRRRVAPGQRSLQPDMRHHGNSSQPGDGKDSDPPIRFDIGDEEITISNRYETLSIINDILIGIFFFVGSVLFYFKPLEFWAITLFVLGSVDFLLRPIIRLARRFHLQRIGKRPDDQAAQEY